jgi:hypothetical protein
VAKRKRKMRGKVEKVIPPVTPDDSEKVQISVDEAEDLYKEIRIENVVTDEKGKEHRLKPGSQVDVTVESDEAEPPKES